MALSGGVVAFIADDEAAAQAALHGVGIEYQLRPALTVRMENLPGAGAATFHKLADAEVNVEFLLPVRISDKEFFAVICAIKPRRFGDRAARRARTQITLGEPACREFDRMRYQAPG